MEALISRLKALYPQLRFAAGKSFSWSPETNEIFYPENLIAGSSQRSADSKKANRQRLSANGQEPLWALLHETGHALLGHTTYQADYELIRLEVAAWEKAKELAIQLNSYFQEPSLEIDEEHVQDCLDTYRDWLYKRSICPECGTKCLQQDDYVHYRCHNCHTTWRVTPARFARAYRRSKNVPPITTMFY